MKAQSQWGGAERRDMSYEPSRCTTIPPPSPRTILSHVLNPLLSMNCSPKYHTSRTPSVLMTWSKSSCPMVDDCTTTTTTTSRHTRNLIHDLLHTHLNVELDFRLQRLHADLPLLPAPEHVVAYGLQHSPGEISKHT